MKNNKQEIIYLAGIIQDLTKRELEGFLDSLLDEFSNSEDLAQAVEFALDNHINQGYNTHLDFEDEKS